MREAIDQLPDVHQAVLTLHCFEGMSVARIATVLGVAPGTVKSRMSRAREGLRAALNRGDVEGTPS